MTVDTVPLQPAEIDPILAAQDTPPPRRRRRGPRLKPWWIRAHRWASLTLGLALGVWALGAALARRTPGPAHTAALVILQVLLVGHAILDVGSLLAGHRVPGLATHLGYVAVSVGLLPMLLGVPRSSRDMGPGAVAVTAVGCAALTVVLLRQWATWQPPHA